MNHWVAAEGAGGSGSQQDGNWGPSMLPRRDFEVKHVQQQQQQQQQQRRFEHQKPAAKQPMKKLSNALVTTVSSKSEHAATSVQSLPQNAQDTVEKADALEHKKDEEEKSSEEVQE